MTILKRMKEARDCLTKAECRSEYTRFGSNVIMPESAELKFDWRILMTIGFFLMFAFMQATLASVEQKPGLRISMGLGIVICISEVQILMDVGAQIIDGQKSDPKVETMLGFFPSQYCVFEIITLMRLFYFTAFSLICAWSLTYNQDEEKLKVELVEKIQENSKLLTR